MMKKIIIYGLLAGAFLTLYVNILDASKLIYESEWGAYLGYLAILILPVCIFLAMLEFRKQNQQLLFKHALMVSLIVAFLAASIYSAYTFIDIHFFDASHLKNMYEYTQNEMTKDGKTQHEIAEKIKAMQLHYASSQPYLMTYIWYFAMGIIYTFIFYLFFRFKPKS